MSKAVDSGSDSQHPPLFSELAKPSQDSRTVSYVSAAQDSPPVNEDDKTVISQRPIAPPEEFYRAMPLAELAAMLEGKQLDHFLVETMIGGGGMGAVFRGVDMRLDRVVAIKVIPGSKRDPETLRRFRLEAQAAARLDHPNIARVYYVGEAEQWNYIVFEFIDGINIRDLVEMEGALSVDDAVFYARQVAEALQHAHEREVVHRDVKPSNVLVTAGGIAKLVDMGLARNTSLDKSTADATASGVTLGTFDYISPEQARNPRDADVRSDLYSLGCTLFYMLTGHPPFPEGTALQKLLNHGSQPPPDPRGWRDDLSDELYEVMMKLMAKRPVDRYQKPAELVNDLLILAQMEDLPRSQGPTTLMLNPSVAQRSLLEANLPWLVALSFLLGSTLWLQSFQSLSSGLTLQPLKFASAINATKNSEPELGEPSPPFIPTPAAEANPNSAQPEPATMSPSASGPNAETPQDIQTNTETSDNGPSRTGANSDQPSLDAGNVVSPKPNTPGLLVVSSIRPEDVADGMWEATLAGALRRVQQSANLETNRMIELRGEALLESPLQLDGLDVTIQGASRSGATIQISPSLLEEYEGNAAFELSNAKLRFDNIAFRVRASPETAVGACIFESGVGSDLQLEDCSVTVSTDSPNRMVVFRAVGKSQSGLRSDFRSDLIVTQIRNCFIRGETSMMAISLAADAGPRLEFSFENTLVAVDGIGIELMSGSGPNGVEQPVREQIVRVRCEQSTFITAEGFARLEYSGTGMPNVGLNRASEYCVFWSLSEAPHIAISGGAAGLLDNPNLLLLQGANNAYDSHIEHICQTLADGIPLFDLSFSDGKQEGWFAERAIESVVRWKSSVEQARPFSQAKIEDFALVQGMYAPGYQGDAASPPRLE
ncbi:MAG: serine/threonine-protein kinase [Pirellulaceae bacterium]